MCISSSVSKYKCIRTHTLTYQNKTKWNLTKKYAHFLTRLSVPHPDTNKKWRPHEIQEGIKFLKAVLTDSSTTNNKSITALKKKQQQNKTEYWRERKNEKKGLSIRISECTLGKRILRQWFHSHAFTKHLVVDFNANTHQFMQYAQWPVFYWIWYSCIVYFL